MPKYIIIWGVSGMNSLSYTVEELDTRDQAENWAYQEARDEREGLDGIHGYTSCDEVDEEEYNEDVENDLEYYVYNWTLAREAIVEEGLDPHNMPTWD